MRLRFLDIFFHAFLRASFRYWKQIYALRMESVIISLSFFFSFSIPWISFVVLLKYACEIVFFSCVFLSMYHFNFYIWIWLGKNIIIITYKPYALRSITTQTTGLCIHLKPPAAGAWCALGFTMLSLSKFTFFNNKKCIETIYKSPHFLVQKSEYDGRFIAAQFAWCVPLLIRIWHMLFIVPPIIFRLIFQ